MKHLLKVLKNKSVIVDEKHEGIIIGSSMGSDGLPRFKVQKDNGELLLVQDDFGNFTTDVHRRKLRLK